VIELQDFGTVEAFLRGRLPLPLPGASAHRRFAPRPEREGWDPAARPPAARHAAALILLYPGPGGTTLPLTMRRHDLPEHPGQVSFPGGRLDPDETPEQAALRETFEEIGAAANDIRILGPLSTLWVPVSNHVIHPFVGATDRPPVFRLAAREVETLEEVPLADLFDPARLGTDTRVRDGATIQVPFLRLADRQVWGATAMMLGEFGMLFEEDYGLRATGQAAVRSP
jgi:8-oxo-dGTP pyrophosphatase MutT (NUDIX family)